MIIGRDPVPYLRQRGARQNSTAIILECSLALAAPTAFQCQCRYCEAAEKMFWPMLKFCVKILCL